MLVPLVQIAFDAAFRGALEIFRHKLYLLDFCVVGDFFVDFRQGVVQALLQVAAAQSVQFALVVVGIDQGRQSAIFFDDEGIHYVGKAVDHGFQLFGIDVLSGRPQDHALGTASQEEVTVFVHDAHVARAEPAVLREGIGRGFVVLEIAQENIGAAYLHLARYVVRVVGIDADFHIGSCHATGTQLGLVPVGIGDDGSAFRHAVSDGEREADLVQEALHFGVEGRTPQDDFFEIAAEGVDQFGADLLFQYFVQDGQAEEEAVLLQDGFEVVLLCLV